MTDTLIQKLEATINGTYSKKEAYGRGLDQGLRVAIDIIRNHDFTGDEPVVLSTAEGLAPSSPTKEPHADVVEAVAEALCPIIKPWMDSHDTKSHPCRRCIGTEFHGEITTPMCKLVMRDSAKAAIAAYEQRNPLNTQQR